MTISEDIGQLRLIITNLEGYCPCCYSYTKNDINTLKESIERLNLILENEIQIRE